eukprot:3260516-Alexandrium_andersonii.AAC.1
MGWSAATVLGHGSHWTGLLGSARSGAVVAACSAGPLSHVQPRAVSATPYMTLGSGRVVHRCGVL